MRLSTTVRIEVVTLFMKGGRVEKTSFLRSVRPSVRVVKEETQIGARQP